MGDEIEADPLELLAGVLDHVHEVRSGIPSTSTTGGRHVRDRASLIEALNTEAPVDRVTRCASYWTLMTADMCQAAATLMRARGAFFGMFPAFRSALEFSAAVIWLLDETETPLKRASRAAVAEVESARQTAWWWNHLAVANAPVFSEGTEQREALFAEVGAEFGKRFKPGQRRGDCSVAGERLPSYTAIIDNLNRLKPGSPMVGIYSHLCAVGTHPNTRTLAMYMDSSGGAPRARTELLPSIVKPVVATSIGALDHFARWSGADSGPIDALQKHAERVEAALAR